MSIVALTHTYGQAVAFIGMAVYILAMIKPQMRWEAKIQQRIDEALQRENFTPDTSKELRFKGRLTKEDLINLNSFWFLEGLLSRSSYELAMIVGWVVIFVTTGILMYQHTSLQTQQIWPLCSIVGISTFAYRKKIALFFYKMRLSKIMRQQDENTEVIFGYEETTIRHGTNPDKKVPNSSVVFLKRAFGLVFILDGAMIITLPNRILSDSDISDLHGKYEDVDDTRMIEYAKKKRYI